MKPVARKYRFEEVPSELEHWARLPIEERLRAVVEMARFWVRGAGHPLRRANRSGSPQADPGVGGW